VSELEDAFGRLLGYQPTDEERQRLYSVRGALKLKPTDALWSLLMALQHYEALYEKVPARITEEVERVTKAARLTAETQARAAQEVTKKALMGAVEQAAIASRRDGARAELIRRAGWLAGGIVVGVLVVFVIGIRIGVTRGEATGRDRARQECGYMAMAAAWANSPEGQLAFEFARTGSLRELATCSRPGWEIRGDQCIVRPLKGAIYGWTLPGDAREKR
jgi:hypothetical protein